MNQKGNVLFLKSVLLAGGLLATVYGIAYCFFPDEVVRMAGVDPFHPAWLRWSGGTLIAIGIGSVLVFRKPENQRIFVITIAMVTLFAGLSLLYSILGMDKANNPGLEETDNFGFVAAPAFILLLISALLWVSQWKARNYLGSFK